MAKIDGTTSELALKRYGIRGFPTIMLLHKGRVWGYEGRRTVEGLQRFVEAPTNLVGAVPSDWRPWDEAAHALQSAWDDVQFVFSDLEVIIHSPREEERPKVGIHPPAPHPHEQ